MLLQATTAPSLGLLGASAIPALTSRSQVARVPELAVDLSSEPDTLDPVLAYTPDAWSIVHAIYDAPVQLGRAGELEMLAAESLAFPADDQLRIRLRPGLTFHDGTPATGAWFNPLIEHLYASDSQITGNLGTIQDIETVGDLDLTLYLTAPSPWLPAQLAVWMPVVSPASIADGTLADRPVGSGPYRFVSWERGSSIVLEANPDYPEDSPKGRPIADRVVFRFVPDASTRVADLLSGTSHIVRSVPVDQAEAVGDGGAAVVAQPLSGVAFIRIPTDVEPFSDPRFRLALNHAVDVEAIVDALLGGNGRRLPNLFVPNGLGFDDTLAPHAFDPGLARELLGQAGVGDGFSTRLAYATSERKDILEAVAAMLGEVGVDVELVGQEPATFNAEWASQEAPALRFATWRPVTDPFTLLNLVVSERGASKGFLSRHSNPDAQALIDAAAVEMDPATRDATYRELGRVLRDAPAAIYLWDLTALYGVATPAAAWSPRADDYIVPTSRS